VPEYHTKINVNNFLESLYTLVPFVTYIVQYLVYVNLCEYNRIFTLIISHSGEVVMGKKTYQKFGWNHNLYFV